MPVLGHELAGGQGTFDHDELENVTPNQHHNQVHDLFGEDHLGEIGIDDLPDHDSLHVTGLAGYIQFKKDGADEFDSDSQLYWDKANHRLGIGRTPDAYPLEVSSSGRFANTLVASVALAVGIFATGNRAAALELYGDETYSPGFSIARAASGANAPTTITNRGTGGLAFALPDGGLLDLPSSGFTVGGAAASGNYLVGNGTAFVSTAPPATWTPAAHVLDGATHTVSGLTSDHVLKATGATTFGFGALPAHTLVSATHSATGLTAGHVLRASNATTFGFAALQTSDIPDLSGTYSVTSHNHSGVYALVAHNNWATQVLPTTTNFNGILNPSTDTDLQLCLDKLDDHAHAALYAAIDHDATHITSGSDEIDGDKLDIDWNPTNYTPALVTDYSTSLDHLTSHLKGIDTALVAAEGSDTQILFNDGGVRAGDSGLTFVKATDSLYVAGCSAFGTTVNALYRLRSYFNQTSDPGGTTRGFQAYNKISASSAQLFTGAEAIAEAAHTSGTVSDLRGFYGGITTSGAGGTTTYANAVYGLLNLAAGSVTTATFFRGLLYSTAATITTVYGMYMPNITGASTNWASYWAGGNSYHAGSWKQDAEHICKLISTPSSPASGYLDLYAKTDAGNSIQRFHRLTNAGAEVPIDGGYKAITESVSWAYGDDGSKTVIASTLPANAAEVGATYIIEAWGYTSSGFDDTETITFSLWFAGVQLANVTPSYISSDADMWRVSCVVTIRSVGASGTAIGQIEFGLWNVSIKQSASSSASTVNTTGTMEIALLGDPSTLESGESITCTHAYIRREV